MPETANQHPIGTSGSCCRTKAEGAFIGLASGDALGWPQELPRRVLRPRDRAPASIGFNKWTRRGGSRFYPYEEEIQPGAYSDDTQLLLAVARCRTITGSAWWNALTRTELPLWTLYERGGGVATKRAVESWIKGTPPWKGRDADLVGKYFDAGGNGAAMRTLVHAVFYAGEENPAALLRDVVIDGAATHGHPRALVGAAAYAYAAWWLLRSRHTIRFGELLEALLDTHSAWGALPQSGDSKNGWFDAANRSQGGEYEALWRQVVAEMRVLLDRARSGLGAGAIAEDEQVLSAIGCFDRAKGAGTVTTAAAVYLCARYAAQPVQAVLKAAYATGADTDTLAAMSGGLMGCLAGSDWLPRQWFDVQDCDYLQSVANRVALGPSGAEEKHSGLRAIGLKELEALRAALVEGQEGELDLDGVRRVRLIDVQALKALSLSTLAQRWELRSSDGQTLYITRVGRKTKPEAKQPASEDQQPQPLPARVVAHASATAIGVKLSVTSLNAVAAFYEDVLGLKAMKRSPRYVSYGPVSLVDARYASQLSMGTVASTGTPGRSRITICVTDIEAAFRRVQGSGFRVVQSITRMPWGERVFHCLDPEQNPVEVTEHRL